MSDTTLPSLAAAPGKTGSPAAPPRRSTLVLALARAEARRMVRNPVLLLGLVVTAVLVHNVNDADWAGARYGGYVAALGGLLWAVSVVAVSAGARARQAVAEEAPARADDRALGRLLGGGALVGLVAVAVAAAATWLRATGGLDLGEEPGRTAHAHYTAPELLQPVVLAALAVVIGLALGSHLRRRFEAYVAVTLLWYVVAGLWWVFNGPATQAVALIQVQPVEVPLWPVTVSALNPPEEWLLARPGQYREGWARLVVSPEIAAWHLVYLVGLTVLVAAAVVPRRRGRVAAAGLALAGLGAAAQYLIWP